MSATNAYNTNRLYWTTQFQQYIRFVLQGVQVTIDNTNRLYCRWFKLPPTIQTVCIVIDNTNRLYCSWLAIQTVCIIVGLQYKRFVLSAPQYKPFVLSSMQYKLFVLQLRATIQTVCIAGGSSYHTCGLDDQSRNSSNWLFWSQLDSFDRHFTKMHYAQMSGIHPICRTTIITSEDNLHCLPCFGPKFRWKTWTFSMFLKFPCQLQDKMFWCADSQLPRYTVFGAACAGACWGTTLF